jgi:hypothetical protein
VATTESDLDVAQALARARAIELVSTGAAKALAGELVSMLEAAMPPAAGVLDLNVERARRRR